MFNKNQILAALFSCAIAVFGLKTAIHYSTANIGYYAANELVMGVVDKLFMPD